MKFRVRKVKAARVMNAALGLTTFLLLATALSTPSAHAISEKNYRANFDAIVAPFVQEHFISGTLEGAKGIRLAYRKSRVMPLDGMKEKGVIVFAPGMGEGAFRYWELAYDFAQKGYSFYVLDPRGQGASERIVSPIQSVYVESYDDYVEDLHRFVTQVVQPEGHERIFLLTNSMGGLYGALELEKHPGDFVAAVLSVPMFGFDLGGMSEEAAYLQSKRQVAQGRGAEYDSDQEPPDLKWRPEPPATSGHDQRIVQMMDYLEAHPGEATGGCSIRWVLESIIAQRHARRATPATLPILILQGAKDETVPPEPQQQYCDRAAHCRIQRFEAGGHGLLTGDDVIRDATIATVLDFFATAAD